METHAGNPEGRRVFVAGATGAIGRILVPKLVGAGHEVTAMTRSADKAHELSRLGANPVVCDVFDRDRLAQVVADRRPEVVVNQLTELPTEGLKPWKLRRYYRQNDRVRREGTDNLLAAARAAGAGRFVSQSVAFFYEPEDGPVKGEEAPLWRSAPQPFADAVDAVAHAERAPLDAGDIAAVVLRYGTFYGPGTWYASDGEIARQMRRRQYPQIGTGEGHTSFIHVDDAADACVEFLSRGAPGIYNVVDDEPAPAREWMPVFAEAVGAKPPRRVPEWLARPVAGKGLVAWATTVRGASNEKLKRELGWQPRHASWRRGFFEALA